MAEIGTRIELRIEFSGLYWIGLGLEWIISRVLQAGKGNFETGQKHSKMTFLGLKMIIFGHFSPFLASFKISFSSLQQPSYETKWISRLELFAG